jgi:crotonobetainyl-CoA:carnitine CoA-transferase CaiB-like acyl-CoA transferase
LSGIAPTPLDDLGVVEISDRIAGAYCGKLLVDAGADVVKVKPAGGDPLRRFTATGAVPPAGADAPLFSYLNSGKRSLTAASEDLLTRADVVIIAAIGREFDPQPLLDESPRCVVVTVSDFGLTGRGPTAPRRSSRCRPGRD